MAMLSERDPRDKIRYVLQPRKRPLYEDETNIGTKLLKKMGWNGKGLGAKEDGDMESIRAQFKANSAGLGHKERNDQWTAHEVDFNSLLAKLSSENNSDSNEKDGPKQFISGESLEEKSKKSRARVHYKKFTKGKDISQYSEKDIANIFGKKSINPIEKTKIKTSIIPMPELVSTLTVSDYFKNKMDKKPLKSTNVNDSKQNIKNDDNLDLTIVKLEDSNLVKKKKKDKKRKNIKEKILVNEEIISNEINEKMHPVKIEFNGHIIKKDKTINNEGDDTIGKGKVEDLIENSIMENNEKLNKKIKKCKKKKKELNKKLVPEATINFKLKEEKSRIKNKKEKTTTKEMKEESVEVIELNDSITKVELKKEQRLKNINK